MRFRAGLVVVGVLLDHAAEVTSRLRRSDRRRDQTVDLCNRAGPIPVCPGRGRDHPPPVVRRTLTHHLEPPPGHPRTPAARGAAIVDGLGRCVLLQQAREIAREVRRTLPGFGLLFVTRWRFMGASSGHAAAGRPDTSSSRRGRRSFFLPP